MPENPNPNGPNDQGAKDGDPAKDGQGNPNPNGPDSGKPDASKDGDPAKDKDGEGALGEGGLKALQSERSARKEAESKAAELEAEVKRLQRANAAVKGHDLEAIRTEIRAEFQTQLLESEIRAEAKGKVVEAGEVAKRYPEYFKDVKAGDADGLTKAVAKLLEDKPYLAEKTDDNPGWGDVGGGQREAVVDEPSSPTDRLRRAYGATK
ncbi:head scaffolding protein [Streptomyces phage SF1]|uniref:Scaffolding protein n=2 Tax=Caudoviricetes TaxID=2731619 RepID=A0A0K1Y586_9CAUD|nr:head scaffolding protein [Streptomyces phage SF1]YP_009796727.1 head scaffolding protein [Streptomyces phage AbbeyMikolon]AKY02154.1 hypothetical protein SF1_50 [Streptomyces phage SF1]AUG87078.1 scaffolding protein [Streptomyces phage AbbeyMikolon]